MPSWKINCLKSESDTGGTTLSNQNTFDDLDKNDVSLLTTTVTTTPTPPLIDRPTSGK